MTLRALRRDVCPQKYKQDSRDYIAPRPCDVRRLRPTPRLLVRLQGHVAHDVPLALLAVYRRYRSTVPANAGDVLGTDLNCSESLGCHRDERLSISLKSRMFKARRSFAVGENAPNGCDQTIKFDRLGVELVAARRERLFAFAGERMCGQGDDGDLAGLRIALEPSRSFPAVDDGHFEVHQDDIGALAERHCAALLAILRRQHLEIAEQLEPHLEHEDVVVVVFHVKHFGHDPGSIPLITSGFFCASRRMRSTRSAGRNLSLTSTDCTPEFSRARSLASRSRAVMTMTGMSRQPASFCNAATTAKPSISGIIRSSRITSGLLSCIRLSASRPFSASCTLHCGPSSHPRIRSRCTASSSTSRTHVGGTAARKRLTSRCSRSRSIGLVR